jgi:hypothetical protein
MLTAQTILNKWLAIILTNGGETQKKSREEKGFKKKISTNGRNLTVYRTCVLHVFTSLWYSLNYTHSPRYEIYFVFYFYGAQSSKIFNLYILYMYLLYFGILTNQRYLVIVADSSLFKILYKFDEWSLECFFCVASF